MSTPSMELTTFHLTGERAGGHLDDVGGLDLRPALFTDFRDLTRLRYDYPLVLTEGEEFVASLTGLIDDVLQEKAPEGVPGERLRRHLLNLEEEIRVRVADGKGGTLRKLIEAAEKSLLKRASGDDKKVLKESLAGAKAALRVDGEVVDCCAEAPDKILGHAWETVHRAKEARFQDVVGKLAVGLSDILKADYMKSDKARTPDTLKGAMGAGFAGDFDFDALSGILADGPAGSTLAKKRRSRIRDAMGILETQKFFAPGAGVKKGKKQPYSFRFSRSAEAEAAYVERVGEMVDLIKSIAIAELEVENRYSEEKHDPYFEHFDVTSLTADDLALFPSYLVSINDSDMDDGETAKLLGLLRSNLPMKVLVRTDDILAQASQGAGRFSFGAGALQLATMAVGAVSAYVLQSAGSHLYRMRDAIGKGMRFQGAALFSVYSGATPAGAGIPAYLSAAAAMQSRAFPAFTYDPEAGKAWATRFSVGDNPQSDADWPAATFEFEDDDLQRDSEEVHFTFIDYVACDKRYAEHFARVPRSRWDDTMMPLGDYLGLENGAASGKVPYILMVDADNALQKVIVEDRLIEAGHRCTEMWHSLQEMGGIHNAHALRLLAEHRADWEAEKEAEIEALKASAAPASAAQPAPAEDAQPAPADAALEEEEAEEAPPSDDPYIETPRCTTCNECTDINNKMFVYNDNKQAVIADLDAGTFKDLVEAAETCQVAIIHPGKPKNPDESNLDDLIKRAEVFN